MSVEAQVSSRDGPNVSETAVEEELQSCHPVKEYSVGNGGEDRAFRQVFHQQRQVVAEVEICLTRRTFRQSAATDMIHLRLRTVHNLEIVIFNAPAEVYLFHVSEKTVV